MLVTCPKCQHTEEVKWSIVGLGVEFISIGYRCPQCKIRYLIGITLEEKGFYTSNMQIIEEPVLTGDPDYIG